jgi:hypothetical protein
MIQLNVLRTRLSFVLRHNLKKDGNKIAHFIGPSPDIIVHRS